MYRTEKKGIKKTYKKCKYFQKDIEDKCSQAFYRKDKEKRFRIYDFYKINEINYLSSTQDDKYLCNEVICKWLLNKERYKKFAEIKWITRKNSYIVGHDGIQTNLDSGRDEEIIAKKLFNKTLDLIGKVCDYQVPLKDYYKDTEEKSGIGKIDLISVDEENDIVYIFELKEPNSHETILRCVLEGYTYYKLLNKKKFLEDLQKNKLIKKEIDKYKIIVSPLVFEDSQPYREMDELKEYRTNLDKLIGKLIENEYNHEEKEENKFFGGIKPYYLVEESEGKYSCHQFLNYNY